MLINVLIVCRWYRAQINELLDNDYVSLFFVDHGDKASVSVSDVAPITAKLIKKLPFQVSAEL
jgi:hypothetical protein